MEVHSGFVRGSEQGGGNVCAAESTNHGAGVQWSVADL